MRLRKLHLATIASVALLGWAACDNSIMDVGPKDQISDQAVFSDPNLAQAFINDMYLGMGTGLDEVSLGSVVDESMFTHGGTEDIVQSHTTASSRSAADPTGYATLRQYNWPDVYSRIRQTNVFLSHIDDTEFDPALKQRMKGEALFLRAYFYHNLMRMYGGVPIITQVYGLGEDYSVARNSFEETVDFVVAQADSAADLLPLSYSGSDLGRVTKGAALALKARTLLYAASDLYNVNPSGQPETGYTSAQDRTALWRAAKDAAKEVMDLGIYSLFRPDPASPEEAAQNYHDLFLQKMDDEVILSRFNVAVQPADWNEYNPGLFNGPNGYHNWGSNTPLQALVDDYRMIDGSKFDWSNAAEAGAPYENRDPRFYGTINFDGAKWGPRPSDVQALDPLGVVQTFRELKLPDGTIVPGLDTRAGPVEDWNGGYTGYYLRKWLDPSVNGQFVKQETPWIFFRYAEILLDYAEASIELGELQDAVDALNQIRRRAAMPELSASMGQAALREEYRNERRVELAFEEHRFFDVRRWMIAPQKLDSNAKGINIFAEGTSPLDRSTWTSVRYEVHDVQDRAWDDKMYFAAIPRDEINRNELLTQNPGY